MNKEINEYGKEHYTGVKLGDTFDAGLFYQVPEQFESNIQWALHTNLGSFTVLNRMTGFGHRDTETGYRDTEGKFWLASGGYDVRCSGVATFSEAIEWVKSRANNCVGI